MRRYLVVPVLVIAAIALAACGSSGSSKPASSATSSTIATTTTNAGGPPSGVGIATAKGIRLFLACMRSHGVNMPTSGPGSNGFASPSQLPAAIRNSAKFKTAYPICQPDIIKYGGVATSTTAPY